MPRGAADRGQRRERELQRELLPLAPFLYVAWADGALSAAELAVLRERAGQPGVLDDNGRAALRSWLDPTDPPTTAEVERLLELIRTHGTEAADLAELGASMAAGAPGAELQRALAELQDALGVTGPEAARALLGTAPAAPPQVAAPAPFDVAALHRYIDADNFEIRQRVLDVLTRDEFRYVDTRDTAAYRERVLDWTRALAAHGFGALALPREFGGADDVGASVAVFETIAYHDLSLLVKYGVHFGLFGGSIHLLGTRRHHERWLRAVGTLELPGCFAMTETAHGSNVRDLETTATYDVATREFVVHTPRRDARKDYIGNAARHGRMAVVFAQLITPAGAHGVHALLVPIRDEGGATLPGITIEDCGLKVGLNGVDNGRITFDQVRVPRENLLDRYGSVSEGGAYTSPIASPGRRFFTMIGTLVAGRISIACASLSAAKSGLAIAVRYTDSRRQFGPEAGAQVPVLDYRAMQRRLLPRVATAYALDFALSSLVRQFAQRNEDNAQEIETLAAALKAYASDWTASTLQTAREACAGQGYLAENRIGRLRADTDVFTTFEGANDVLYQLVARGRLTEYRAQFGELKLWDVARYIGSRAATRVTELNPIATRRSDAEHLLDPAFHAAAFRYREERLLASLARRLKHRIDRGMDSFDALNECQDHALELGRACAERYTMERFQQAVLDCPDPASAAVLGQLAALFALSRLEAAAGWFLESGYFERAKAGAIRNQVNELCRQIRPLARPLTDAFGIPDALLAAPIALRG
ncbi:MAG TPA: acyl-CoA dehydrogenase [Longimicrobiales bacterium]|nr:acyl-CoA dehydrogenase [Longimicrobiales bacterium]